MSTDLYVPGMSADLHTNAFNFTDVQEGQGAHKHKPSFPIRPMK